MEQRRTLVVVLCMHRTGSSFVTSLLERLGMSLGPFALLPPSETNTRGYFEAEPLKALNDELQLKFLGFDGEAPGSAEVFRRFRRTQGEWPAEPPIPDDLLRHGRELIELLLASGPISGFKDPRTVLTWPFWRRVLAEISGLAVVPVMLVRSPHEIATSLFLRSGGQIAYRQALDLVEVHFRRMQAIRGELGGNVPVVCFDPRTLADETRQVVRRCGLRWDEAIFHEVYDPECRHHEALAVTHPAQQAFEELRGPGGGASPGGGPVLPDPGQMLTIAAAREDFLHGRVVALEQQLAVLRQENLDQKRLAEQEIALLAGELTLLKGSRTWRLRKSILAAARCAKLSPVRR
jgi:hypothetical protein